MQHGVNYLQKISTTMHGGDSLYARVMSNAQWAQVGSEKVDIELDLKTKKVADKLSESLNMVANEPSLAFYRIQEHVRKSMPQLVEQKHEHEDLQQKIQGACFDTEYAINAVRDLRASTTHFENIQELMKNAMFMKQQLEYRHSRRKQEKVSPSMYSPARHQHDSASVSATELTVSSDSDNILNQSATSQSSGVVETQESQSLHLPHQQHNVHQRPQPHGQLHPQPERLLDHTSQVQEHPQSPPLLDHMSHEQLYPAPLRDHMSQEQQNPQLRPLPDHRSQEQQYQAPLPDHRPHEQQYPDPLPDHRSHEQLYPEAAPLPELQSLDNSQIVTQLSQRFHHAQTLQPQASNVVAVSRVQPP